ncbi:MAG: DUF1573 domain-containing protein [Phycisphaerales bacterium]|nr:DUF1573 domain-containing protein [Phycisphaerales bacterium]
MKKRRLVIAGLSLQLGVMGSARALAQAQNEPPKGGEVQPASELQSLAVVSAGPESVGVVKQGQVASRTILFRNKSLVPVAIEIVSKSCSCLDTTFSRPFVMPGETTSLTVGTAALPGADQWLHQVTFRCVWSEGESSKSELGRVFLSYTCAIPFVLVPEHAVVTKTVGDMGAVEFDIYMLGSLDPLPEIADVTCTIEGWKVRRLDRDPMNPNHARFRAEGRVGSVGYQEGTIQWMAPGNESQPMLKTPLHITSLWPLRSMPGGAVFVPHGPDESMTKAVRLIERAGVTAKAWSVSLVEESEWVSASLDAEGVKVTLRAGEKRPDFGSARARVLDADGKALLEFPIAWWTAATSPPR